VHENASNFANHGAGLISTRLRKPTLGLHRRLWRGICGVAMLAVSPRWLFSAALAGLLFLGCGGSASETPPPLPPLPLNEPYRTGGIREGRRVAPPASSDAAASETESESEAELPQLPAREGGTWGKDQPAPLPELAPNQNAPE
jgi:hypothetical protein